jgi:hypothetical protein
MDFKIGNSVRSERYGLGVVERVGDSLNTHGQALVCFAHGFKTWQGFGLLDGDNWLGTDNMTFMALAYWRMTLDAACGYTLAGRMICCRGGRIDWRHPV